jgi:hypothetical protein
VRRCMPVDYNFLLKRRSSSRTLSARRRPQKGVLGVHISGGQKYGSRRVLNRDYGEHEREQSTPLLQLPPLCADWCEVWRCHEEGLDSSSWLAEQFFFFLTPLMFNISIWTECDTTLEEFHQQDSFTLPEDTNHDFFPQQSAPWIVSWVATTDNAIPLIISSSVGYNDEPMFHNR